MRDKPCGQAGLGLRTRGRLGLVGAGWSWTTNSWAFGSRGRLGLVGVWLCVTVGVETSRVLETDGERERVRDMY